MGLGKRALVYADRILSVEERYEELTPLELEQELDRIEREITEDREVTFPERVVLFREMNYWR